MNKDVKRAIRKRIPSFIKRPIFALLGKGVRTAPKHFLPIDIQKEGFTIAYTPEGGVCIPRSHLPKTVAQHLLRGEQYEWRTLQYIEELPGTGDIVHAGAYIGDMLAGLSRVAGKARVWTFEPGQLSFTAAKVTCLINQLENVDLRQMGLSDQKQTVFLRTANAGDDEVLAGSARIETDQDAGRGERIEVDTLDNLIPTDRSIKVLHLDIEGHEEAALTGARELITRTKPFIILEHAEGHEEFMKAEFKYVLKDKIEPKQAREGFRNYVYTPAS